MLLSLASFITKLKLPLQETSS